MVQVAALFLVLKIGNEALDGIYHFGFGEVVALEEGFQLGEEAVHLVHVMAGGFRYAKGLERLHMRLNRISVLFTAYVLVGRKVDHDVEALLLAEDALEDGVGKIERVAAGF